VIKPHAPLTSTDPREINSRRSLTSGNVLNSVEFEAAFFLVGELLVGRDP
jgi:hypothetical protein